MNILHDDWPLERLRQAAWRYEVLRRIPPYLHQMIWIYTLKHSTLDEVVDRIGAELESRPERHLGDIVSEVIEGKRQ